MAIVLYARKSVERENSISCETQLEYCRAMLKPDEREETIIDLVDNGFSGGNTDRDGFQKMMKLVRQGKVRKVIVYRLDRISRSLSDFVSILHEFKAYRVEFVSSQESFDTSSPYGEMIVKILMVFAEFERTSIINRVTQAYAHRSEMGFYMGGRVPYGFELVPAVLHNVQTKKLYPIPAEAQQVQYIFEVYAQESVSLRQLLAILAEEGKQPLRGSNWTTSKLSALLKNPLYVKADSDVYDYYDRRGVRIVGNLSQFTGEFGAQLYGCSKHPTEKSDRKLVLLSHPGLIDSGLWLKCQRKLARNHQIGNSLSNHTSWLSGKVICEQCGRTMTTIKGKPNQYGAVRRYFHCTGKSQQKTCTGPKATIYAQDLEDMVDACITQKLSQLCGAVSPPEGAPPDRLNDLKLRLFAVEKSQQQLMDAMLSQGFNEDFLALANARATKLRQEHQSIEEQIEELKRRSVPCGRIVDFVKLWNSADDSRKKAAALILIEKILIRENGDVLIVWNL